jgi:hypothetical protein
LHSGFDEETGEQNVRPKRKHYFKIKIKHRHSFVLLAMAEPKYTYTPKAVDVPGREVDSSESRGSVFGDIPVRKLT